MSKQAVIINQDTRKTYIKCPCCKLSIAIHHGAHHKGINDDTGRIDLGQQNYQHVVCTSRSGGQYCSFAADFNLKTGNWSTTNIL